MGSRGARRAHLLAAARALPREVTRRICERCFGTGHVGGVEWIPPMTARKPKTGEVRHVGGGYGFVSRTCPFCRGEGDVPIRAKPGRGGGHG